MTTKYKQYKSFIETNQEYSLNSRDDTKKFKFYNYVALNFLNKKLLQEIFSYDHVCDCLAKKVE